MNLFKTYLSIICIAVLIAAGCKKDEAKLPPTVPVVTTAALTNVTTSGATSGGSIVSDGGAAVTASGIVWSKSNATPTLADTVIAGTTATGTFTTNITGLDFNTSYYIRAFATNSVGTGYGEVLTLNTTDDTTKVKFTYNGEEVVYAVIISPTTGKKWLDRNLGAQQVATSFDDYKAYGDIFQWGRPADGHQLINWTASDAGTAANGTTNEVATNDMPGHSNFILYPTDASTGLDWRNDNNRNRWSASPVGPCPAGWHVPTIDEWKAETSNSQGGTANSGGIDNSNTAYNFLKLTTAGNRKGSNNDEGGIFLRIGTDGYYWSSSDDDNGRGWYLGAYLQFGGEYVQVIGFLSKAAGLSVRCTKD